MAIEEFPETGEPDGERYIFITSRDGDFCRGYRDGKLYISDCGDPITPILWGRKPAIE